ncbi:hypothetical protein L3Y34_015377 [Caenorhabditis briggsae]|uniref:Uncharacterized protein n=1 Tax=Caenorhabditis briggsae TaxID=6238 RepID=A0AAE9DWF8_CAEBR|nr:hypothetical protein L3Y34_015377 [Caenorhabditis briggsae]
MKDEDKKDEEKKDDKEKKEEKKEDEKEKEDEKKDEKKDEKEEDKKEEKKEEKKDDKEKKEEKKDQEKKEEKKEEEKKEEKKEEEKKEEKKEEPKAGIYYKFQSPLNQIPIWLSKLINRNRRRLLSRILMTKKSCSKSRHPTMSLILFGTIEAGKTAEVTITRNKAPAKEAKLVIVNSVFSGDDKDLAKSFKTGKPTGGQVTIKMNAK